MSSIDDNDPFGNVQNAWSDLELGTVGDTNDPNEILPAHKGARFPTGEALRSGAGVGELVGAADIRAVRGTSGTKIPELLSDWRNATIQARIEELALEKVSAQPGFDQAVAAEMQTFVERRGLELDERGTEALRTKIAYELANPDMPKAMAEIAEEQAGTPARDQKLIDDSLKIHGARLKGRFDPFTPIAKGDAKARAKETVLWENRHVMLLVDNNPFAPNTEQHPRVLVIPKKAIGFPDKAGKMLDELAKYASAVSSAFSKVAKTPQSEMYINAPQDLTVSQMHVHVFPGLPTWDEQGVTEQQYPSAAGVMWSEMKNELIATLGPSS